MVALTPFGRTSNFFRKSTALKRGKEVKETSKGGQRRAKEIYSNSNKKLNGKRGVKASTRL